MQLSFSLSQLPLLPGAEECMLAGVRSSLHEANTRAAAGVQDTDTISSKSQARWLLMFDPQTAGGLLAGVHADAAEECVAALKGRGYTEASVIGCVGDMEPGLNSFVAVEQY